MFKSLRNKMLIINMVLLSFVMIISFSVIYVITYSNTQSENKKKLGTVPDHSLTGELDLSGEGAETTINNSGVSVGYNPSFVLKVNDNGTLGTVSSFLDLPEDVYKTAFEKAWAGKPSEGKLTLEDRKWQYTAFQASIVTQKDGQTFEQKQWQIVFLDITDSEARLFQLFITFILVGIGMLAVLFFVCFWFANRAIRPIEESWEKQKQFVADASHELKTPLATIMTNCDVLEANEDETIKSQKEWLDYIKIGTDRMNSLLNSLLTLARTEGMSIQAEKQSFDMRSLVCDFMQSMDAAASAKKLCIERDVGCIEKIYGYEESVRQVFAILYENAVKYADDGGSINVLLRRIKKGVMCAVRNTGKGIPAKDLPHIFDRFYRSDAARSNEENSYGLGLSIAKSVAEQIGGKITVKSTENEWTEFVFTFEI